jgi:hypothetical protein
MSVSAHLFEGLPHEIRQARLGSSQQVLDGYRGGGGVDVDVASLLRRFVAHVHGHCPVDGMRGELGCDGAGFPGRGPAVFSDHNEDHECSDLHE